jgi:WD40 repeat protein
MNLPELTPEQRDAALRRAAEVRRERADLGAAIRSGALPLAAALDPGGPAGQLKVHGVLVTALGRRGADQVLAESADGGVISDPRRVRSLSDGQRRAVLAAVDALDRPARPDRGAPPEVPAGEPTSAPAAVEQFVFPDAVGPVTASVPVVLADRTEAVVSGGADGTLRIWDPASGRQRGVPVPATDLDDGAPVGPVRELLALRTPAGAMVAVRCADELAYGEVFRPVRLWEPDTGRFLADVAPPPTESYEIAALPDGDRGDLLGIHHDGGPVACFAPRTGAPAETPAADPEPRPPAPAVGPGTAAVTALCALPGEAGPARSVCSVHEGEADGATWDPATGRRTGVLAIPAGDGEDGPAWSLHAAAAGGRVLLVASWWATVATRAVGAGASVSWQPHDRCLTDQALLRLADGRLVLATAGEVDGLVLGAVPDTVRLWDPLTGAPLPTRGSCYATALATLPDGRLLACAGDDGLVYVLDPATGATRAGAIDLPHRATQLLALRARDRTILASASTDDGAVRLWDLASGAHLATVPDAYPGRMIAFPHSAGTDALVVADTASGVTCWDPVTAAPLTSRLTGHVAAQPYEDLLQIATVHPAGGPPFLVTGGTDGTLRRWRLPTR